MVTITKSASILQLDLEHLHGCGYDNLAHSCTTTCQHLPEDRQPAADDTQAGIKNPNVPLHNSVVQSKQ